MSNYPSILAAIVMAALTVYALTGGADFGGGVWDLFATGRRRDSQRDKIAKAIGPIWEANHVWLILVIVLLFVCFPTAFAAISTALHIPLTLMLFGIVLRGSTFVFRTYEQGGAAASRRWGRIFAITSTISPVMLGICAGAVASGSITLNESTQRVNSGFVDSWLAPFPIAVGFFTLSLFALLAANYLCVECQDDAKLQGDFRRRALISAFLVAAMAATCFLLSESGAPLIRRGLAGLWWSLGFQILTGLCAVANIISLVKSNFFWARIFAVAQTCLILWGWGLAQFPYIIVGDLTFQNAAAPDNILQSVLVVLGLGSLLLVPAFIYLFKVFKGVDGTES